MSSHVPDVVDSCRTRKIVEDDRISMMRKKVWNQKFWRINNRSAQQSRVRKLQYISELERNVNSLQGVLDGSLDFHHTEKRFLGFSRGTSSLDADVHRKYIYEGHRVDNMSVLLRRSKQEKLLEFDLQRGILGSWLKSMEARFTLKLRKGISDRKEVKRKRSGAIEFDSL
ncbi:60S ribosomal protein L5 [Tanacetum coccineum]|uniref:60S ribosomal protein L5 n=1 Tax=Tanacetum coccineum TaxID=301880 RepID=A0ABQ5GR35_9ASTR